MQWSRRSAAKSNRRRRALTCAALCFSILSCNPAANPELTTTLPADTTTQQDVVTELEVSDQPLASGSYRESDFQPPVVFDVDGEWYAVQRAAGFFDIQRDVGSPDVIAVQFANVDEVAGRDGSSVAVSSAAEAAETLEANSDLTVLGSDRSRMAGRDGYVVDVENASRATQRVVQVPAGDIAIDPGRRLWIAFFDTENGVMAIMVGGSSERWEEALSAAEPILETVAIEG